MVKTLLDLGEHAAKSYGILFSIYYGCSPQTRREWVDTMRTDVFVTKNDRFLLLDGEACGHEKKTARQNSEYPIRVSA